MSVVVTDSRTESLDSQCGTINNFYWQSLVHGQGSDKSSREKAKAGFVKQAEVINTRKSIHKGKLLGR